MLWALQAHSDIHARLQLSVDPIPSPRPKCKGSLQAALIVIKCGAISPAAELPMEGACQLAMLMRRHLRSGRDQLDLSQEPSRDTLTTSQHGPGFVALPHAPDFGGPWFHQLLYSRSEALRLGLTGLSLQCFQACAYPQRLQKVGLCDGSVAAQINPGCLCPLPAGWALLP